METKVPMEGEKVSVFFLKIGFFFQGTRSEKDSLISTPDISSLVKCWVLKSSKTCQQMLQSQNNVQWQCEQSEMASINEKRVWQHPNLKASWLSFFAYLFLWDQNHSHKAWNYGQWQKISELPNQNIFLQLDTRLQIAPSYFNFVRHSCLPISQLVEYLMHW